jgi:hypothetical protein
MNLRRQSEGYELITLPRYPFEKTFPIPLNGPPPPARVPNRSFRVRFSTLICLLIALTYPVTAEDTPRIQSVPQLLERLSSNDFFERQQALDELTERRALAEQYAPRLRERLNQGDPDARQEAAMALAALGIAEQAVIDELLAGMGRRSISTYLAQPERAQSSMAALVNLGRDAVPAIVKTIDDEKYPGRDLAIEALGRIGPAAKDALPDMDRWLRREDPVMVCRIVEAKWRIDGDAAFAIERLVPLLNQKQGRECHAAAHTLVHMGADAKEAVPALISALERFENHNVLRALGELAPHAKDIALPALRGATNRTALADDATIALHNLGEPADKLIPPQLKRLKNSRAGDGSEPMRIVYTVVIQGPSAKAYVTDLVALLKHSNPEVRNAAAWGIPRMFADDVLVIAALNDALNDPETAEEASRSLKMLQEARK